jgi:predicted PurR-regulated permease PerM
MAQGVAWKTIFLVAWSAVVVGSADNLLRPMLVSGKSQIGTLTVFFGVLGGLAAFGFIGLFLGPVILALVLTLIEFAEESSAPASGPSSRPAEPTG